MSDDMELVREYAARQSEPAFAALVARHVNLVYSTALRQGGDAQLAEEITQAVFIMLARKAGSLRPGTLLSGWLYRTARYVAADVLKRQRRRQYYEQEACMDSTLDDSRTEEAWQELSPLLDDAMAGLGQTDRDALMLRYFENKSLREIGSALGTSEEAAKKRVARGLERLRGFFAKRGVALSGAVIAGAVSANAVQAAPSVLAKSVTVMALAKGAAAGGSTLTLIKGALKLMAWTKAKAAVVTGVVVLLTAGTTTVVVKAVNAAQRAAPPDLQGAWEGVEEIRNTSGVLQGEKARSRIVFKLLRTNGVYSATGEFIDTAPEPFQVTRFTYDYPSVGLDSGQNLSYQGTLKAHATEISGIFRIRGISVPMLLKRTATPAAAPEPLAENDYQPRTGSDLQGYWEATLGAAHLAVKIAEPSSGTFRAELDNLTTSWLGQPLSVTYKQPEVKLLVASGAGMFQGEVRNGNTEMVGNWMQGGRRTPVIFQRTSR
ncbi:MAG: sigma-70 family RNA polymerase sigma factor [Verrucomicrobiota bacterium]